MTTVEITFGIRGIPSLQIVWRNPNPVRPHRRRHSVEHLGQSDLYIMQEFVEEGPYAYWATISDLEVVEGGRAA